MRVLVVEAVRIDDRSIKQESVPFECFLNDHTLIISDSIEDTGDEYGALELVGADGVVLFSSRSLKPLSGTATAPSCPARPGQLPRHGTGRRRNSPRRQCG